MRGNSTPTQINGGCASRRCMSTGNAVSSCSVTSTSTSSITLSTLDTFLTKSMRELSTRLPCLILFSICIFSYKIKHSQNLRSEGKRHRNCIEFLGIPVQQS